MEIEGHPTQDIIDELVRRGARIVPGDSTGPDPSSVTETVPQRGFWLYVSEQTYDTEIDEDPPLIV
ncbi:hypothetical protein BH23ACT12_BH23ACT12_22770 [soil metagenome]